MNRTCACGHALDFFGTTGGLRSYCSSCGRSQQMPSDEWPGTLHWVRDHRSNNLTDSQAAYLAQRNRPLKPQTCTNCHWPGAIGELCMLCCDMTEAIMPQVGLMQAHEQWRRRQLERRMGLL